MNLERFRNIFRVRKTRKFEHDPANIYDEHLNGMGERPPGNVPGQRIIEIPGLKSKEGFEAEINNGNAKIMIEELNKNGKEVAASWSAGKIIIYTAGAAGVIGAVGGGIYLLKKRQEEQSKADKRENKSMS